MITNLSDFWRPRLWPCPRWLFMAGGLALCLMAFFNILWPPVGSPAESLAAFLGLATVLTYGRGLRNSAALWLLLAALAVQVLSWGLGYMHHPQWVSDTPEVDRLAKLFIFIAIAWWLGGSTRNTLLVWGLALVGYLVATFTHGDGWQEWWRGLQGERVGFGIRNLQHGSMLFGVSLLGVVVFGPRWIGWPRVAAWRLASWLGVLLLCAVGIVIGQTRAVWLALALALPSLGLIWLVWQARHVGLARLRRRLLFAAGVVLITLTALLAAFHDTLGERLTTENQVIAEVLEGNLDNVPYSSVGIRIHTWVAAAQWIGDRPLVGWGGQGRSLVIDETPWLPEFVKQNFGHLHNFFIETWVAYGLLGLALMGALVIWIGRATWLAWRGGAMPGDMALFACGFFVYWVVVNQFESYLSFSTGVTVHNLIVGGLVTHYWRWCWLCASSSPRA
ncbi:O-antigen ligase family protein [Modicisalibacter radicis]|uniref:O-antigen ligase family protein n=1 Tax=Halomonas sp. EAR18 TaxID=2518972 RepID=UPI001FCEAFA5|nr:O-antigen ligase family protein [Halomonas sp. EAR18]